METYTFNGETVVITDPCYIIRHVSGWEVDKDDWAECSFGHNMKQLGFNRYVVDRNGFGDGSWDVNNVKTGKIIGDIWADSGQTGLFLLDEILKYNPDYVKGNFQGALVLKNFVGEITWAIKVSTIGLPDNLLETARKLNLPSVNNNGQMTKCGLVIEGKGTCDGDEVQFVVDFNNVNGKELPGEV